MKNILIIIIPLSILFSQESASLEESSKPYKLGLGFEFHTFPTGIILNDSEEVDDIASYGVYFPIEYNNFHIEPFISRASWKNTAKYDGISISEEDSYTDIGIGIFMTKYSNNNKSKLYYGARYTLTYYIDETYNFYTDKTELFESYPKTIAPTIGMEHFITNNISFAGECRYNMLTNEITISDVKSETTINYILPIFMLRMYW